MHTLVAVIMSRHFDWRAPHLSMPKPWQALQLRQVFHMRARIAATTPATSVNSTMNCAQRTPPLWPLAGAAGCSKCRKAVHDAHAVLVMCDVCCAVC